MTKRNLNLAGANIDPAVLDRRIREAQKGNVGSFEALYNIFARKVLNFIYRMVRSQEEAEDLTQETFVAVFQKLGTLKDNSRFEPWLFRIARNFVYQRYRTRPPSTVSMDALDEDGRAVTQVADVRKNPDETFQSEELEAVVATVIADLPEKYREVFVLSALQGFSYREIAEIVGHSLPSVKTDIHRARLEVRERVKNYLKV